jgi:hypothetical protein
MEATVSVIVETAFVGSVRICALGSLLRRAVSRVARAVGSMPLGRAGATFGADAALATPGAATGRGRPFVKPERAARGSDGKPGSVGAETGSLGRPDKAASGLSGRLAAGTGSGRPFRV